MPVSTRPWVLRVSASLYVGRSRTHQPPRNGELSASQINCKDQAPYLLRNAYRSGIEIVENGNIIFPCLLHWGIVLGVGAGEVGRVGIARGTHIYLCPQNPNA